MKYITFCEFTSEFLKLSLEELERSLLNWKRLAAGYKVKTLFHGLPMGVNEHAVFVFEAKKYGEQFFDFEREWLGLGTPEAGKHVKSLRTITVY